MGLSPTTTTSAASSAPQAQRSVDVEAAAAMLDAAAALALLRPWTHSPSPLLRRCIGLHSEASTADPFQRDYGAIALTIDVEAEHQALPLPALLRELLDVLVALSRVPGLRARENSAFWQSVFAALQQLPAPADTTVRIDDVDAFPRFRLTVGSSGRWRDPVPRQLDYCRQFLAWDRNHASATYENAMAQLEPIMAVAAPQPPVHVHVCFWTPSLVSRHHQDYALLGSFGGLGGSSDRFQHPSSRWQFEITKSVHVEVIEPQEAVKNELVQLAPVYDDHVDLWFPHARVRLGRDVPIVETARLLESVLGNHVPEAAPGRRQVVIELRPNCGPQVPSMLCALLRHSTRPIDSLTIIEASNTALVLPWILYGVCHGTSRLRVRELVLECSDAVTRLTWTTTSVVRSRHPGRVLVDPIERLQLRKLKFPVLGTTARLRSRRFRLLRFMHRKKLLRSRKPSDTFDVDFDGVPEFDVLAVAAGFVGVLVPRFGFGWVERQLVSAIKNQRRHPVEKAFINRGVSGIRLTLVDTTPPPLALLQLIGFAIKSLAIVAHQYAPAAFDLPSGHLFHALRCCPQLTSLEVENPKLEDVAMAYAAGHCRASQLTCLFSFENEYPSFLNPLIEMLADRHHPGYHHLLHLRIAQLGELYRDTRAMGRCFQTKVHQLLRHNGRLRVVQVEWDGNEVDAAAVEDYPDKAISVQPVEHPILALAGVLLKLPGLHGTAVGMDVLSHIATFSGPAQQIRFVVVH